jgi:MSHA pilin protein MshA
MWRAGRQSGFTIVEIVVVITILGILAAFAVPRFSYEKVEARSAATTALGSSIRSGAALAHAQWLAQDQPPTIDAKGQSVTMVFGYPDKVTIDRTLASLDGFVYRSGGAGNDAVFAKTDDGTTLIADCHVSYAESAAAGAAPEITVVTAGC